MFSFAHHSFEICFNSRHNNQFLIILLLFIIVVIKLVHFITICSDNGFMTCLASLFKLFVCWVHIRMVRLAYLFVKCYIVFLLLIMLRILQILLLMLLVCLLLLVWCSCRLRQLLVGERLKHF